MHLCLEPYGSDLTRKQVSQEIPQSHTADQTEAL